MKGFKNKRGLATFELFTWDFPYESHSVLCSGKIARWLTRCVWNSLPHTFPQSLQLLAFSAGCQASVDLACVSFEPLLFGWDLCLREGYSPQVTGFAEQGLWLLKATVSFVVVIKNKNK